MSSTATGKPGQRWNRRDEFAESILPGGWNRAHFHRMSADARNNDNDQNFTVAVFSVSAGMVGVCLTGIGLLQVVNSVRQISTLADEFLAMDAVLFLGCCFLVFVSFRTRSPGLKNRLRKWADGMFFLGLLMMVLICGLITSTFL